MRPHMPACPPTRLGCALDAAVHPRCNMHLTHASNPPYFPGQRAIHTAHWQCLTAARQLAKGPCLLARHVRRPDPCRPAANSGCQSSSNVTAALQQSARPSLLIKAFLHRARRCAGIGRLQRYWQGVPLRACPSSQLQPWVDRGLAPTGASPATVSDCNMQGWRLQHAQILALRRGPPCAGRTPTPYVYPTRQRATVHSSTATTVVAAAREGPRLLTGTSAQKQESNPQGWAGIAPPGLPLGGACVSHRQ
jgi:hypothetical protein